jgi:hypothetical protein
MRMGGSSKGGSAEQGSGTGDLDVERGSGGVARRTPASRVRMARRRGSGGRRRRARRRRERESTGSLGREKESSDGLFIERERGEVAGGGGRRNGRPWQLRCHQWRRFNGEEAGERERNGDDFLAWAWARRLGRARPVGSTSKRAGAGMARCGHAGSQALSAWARYLAAALGGRGERVAGPWRVGPACHREGAGVA